MPTERLLVTAEEPLTVAFDVGGGGHYAVDVTRHDPDTEGGKPLLSIDLADGNQRIGVIGSEEAIRELIVHVDRCITRLRHQAEREGEATPGG